MKEWARLAMCGWYGEMGFDLRMPAIAYAWDTAVLDIPMQPKFSSRVIHRYVHRGML